MPYHSWGRHLTHRHIAIIILSRGNWPDVKMSIPRILDAINAAKGGSCTLVECLVSRGNVS